ncbi:MAG: apolipoprotein N-acyltransferase [Candidatus Bipolaricaulia bacterium]
MKSWHWGLAIVSGVLTALGLPGLGLDPLIWFSLVPLFFALERTSTRYRRSFLLAYLTGIAFFGVLFHWFLVLRQWEDLFPVLGIWGGYFIALPYLVIILLASIYWGIWGLIYSFFNARFGTLAMLLMTPALWVSFEFIRAQGEFGLTWGDLGYALYRRVSLIQLASITGVWGISFAIVLVNYLLFLALNHLRYRYVLVAGAIIGLLFGVGLPQMDDRTTVDVGGIEVAIVQPGISRWQQLNAQGPGSLLEDYGVLLDGLRPVDLVVLPESFLQDYVLKRAALMQPFRAFAIERSTYLVLGTHDYRDGKLYNTVALITPAGEVAGVYDKRHLVPFGEYIPFRRLLSRLGVADELPVDFDRGTDYRLITASLGTIGAPISFESTFPSISRTFTRQGAELLINVTNDVWYGDSPAPTQQFSKAVFRAVENRRYLVQSSHTRISGIIAPDGEILHRSTSNDQEILYGTVSLQDEQTFYTRYGDWFVYLLAAYLVGAIVWWGVPNVMKTLKRPTER